MVIVLDFRLCLARNQAEGAGPTPDYYRQGIADAREAPARAGVFDDVARRISAECAWLPSSAFEVMLEHPPRVGCLPGFGDVLRKISGFQKFGIKVVLVSALVIITLISLSMSALFLFLGGYRLRGRQITTTTPFLFLLYQDTKRLFRVREKMTGSINYEEENLRRVYKVIAAIPPAMTLSFFALQYL